jgi:hypothetical protein
VQAQQRNLKRKNRMKKQLLIGLLAIGTGLTASAIPITGTIRMDGEVTLDSQNLATANSATFVNPAAAVNSGTGTFTGTESPGGVPDVNWANFSWNPSTAPVNDLWSFVRGGWTYTFDLGSISSVTRIGSTFLLISGVGTLDIVGAGDPYSPTAANWSFTITDTSGGTSGSFIFGFADSNTSVPDGGLTVGLLGIAFTGLALIRRKITV